MGNKGRKMAHHFLKRKLFEYNSMCDGGKHHGGTLDTRHGEYATY